MLAGCAPYQPTPTSDSFFPTTKEYVQNLERQAAFDLKCDRDRLTFKKLDSGPALGTVGVTGCGTRMTYKYVESVGWVANVVNAEP